MPITTYSHAVWFFESDGKERSSRHPGKGFTCYADANRYASEKCPAEAGSVVAVIGRNLDGDDVVLVAYHSLSGLPPYGRGRVAMVDGTCSVRVESLPRYVAESLEWFRSHFQKARCLLSDG